MTCDQAKCSEVEEFDMEEHNWPDMVAKAKENGWMITRNEDDDGWDHTCPACSEKAEG